MNVEIAAIITVSNKLELLDKLLERRIMRSALDLTTPALPLLNKVYKMSEYRRLAANLKVMEHRLSCALGDGDIRIIEYAAARKFGLNFGSKQVKTALKRAEKTLEELGINAAALEEYKSLPLYAAECKKLKRISESVGKRESICCGAEFACSRDGRTAQA